MEQFPDLELYYFAYKNCGPNWHLYRSVHPVNGLVIVLRGEANYRIDGKDYRVRAGEFLYTKPFMEREATTNGMVCAAFDFNLTTGALDLPLISRYNGIEELDSLIRDFEYEWMGQSGGYKLKCGGIFLLILHKLQHGEEAGMNYHIEKIKRYIEDHFAEPIRVESLAALTGLNTVYCGALFRRTQGMTIAQYTNKVRVQKAASILMEKGLNISEVALLCGFNDVYYFSRIFKKIMGVSPRRWEHR